MLLQSKKNNKKIQLNSEWESMLLYVFYDVTKKNGKMRAN